MYFAVLLYYIILHVQRLVLTKKKSNLFISDHQVVKTEEISWLSSQFSYKRATELYFIGLTSKPSRSYLKEKAYLSESIMI